MQRPTIDEPMCHDDKIAAMVRLMKARNMSSEDMKTFLSPILSGEQVDDLASQIDGERKSGGQGLPSLFSTMPAMSVAPGLFGTTGAASDGHTMLANDGLTMPAMIGGPGLFGTPAAASDGLTMPPIGGPGLFGTPVINVASSPLPLATRPSNTPAAQAAHRIATGTTAHAREHPELSNPNEQQLWEDAERKADEAREAKLVLKRKRAEMKEQKKIEHEAKKKAAAQQKAIIDKEDREVEIAMAKRFLAKAVRKGYPASSIVSTSASEGSGVSSGSVSHV